MMGATSLTDLREHLAEAAKDDRVAGLIVHVAECGRSLAVLDELAEIVQEFGRSKPTASWAESFGELDNSLGLYKLATACDRVFVQPTGSVGIGGVEVSIYLLRGALEKVGIDPQFGQRHEFKTAADQFAAEDVTPANREMTTRLAESIVDDAVAAIARRRGIDPEQVRHAVDESPLTPAEALDAGLVDGLAYRDEVYSQLLTQWQATPEQLLYASRYRPRLNLKRLTAKRPKVAVVTLRGGIVTGRGGHGPLYGEAAGADIVDEHLRAVLRDDDYQAVLFEVDSPGGSAVASDAIRRSILQVKASGRPVVARMGAVAASGGYYVSMPCDEIVALPTTLTGSIGVLAGKFVTRRLQDLIGVKREIVRIGSAGRFSTATEFSEDDWRRLDRELDRIYETFVGFAAEDRGMAIEDLEPLARGRVWTGADAQERGLIDHVGGWNLAWRRVCELAGLDPAEAEADRIGSGARLERIIPAKSSEHRAGGTHLRVPSSEDFLTRAAAELGLGWRGALSLPHRIELR